jgi:hypothetical protein
MHPEDLHICHHHFGSTLARPLIEQNAFQLTSVVSLIDEKKEDPMFLYLSIILLRQLTING